MITAIVSLNLLSLLFFQQSPLHNKCRMIVKRLKILHTHMYEKLNYREGK